MLLAWAVARGRSKSVPAPSQPKEPSSPSWAYRVLRKEETYCAMRQPDWWTIAAYSQAMQLRRAIIDHVGYGTPSLSPALISATYSLKSACRVACERRHVYGEKPTIIRIYLPALSQEQVVPLNSHAAVMKWFREEDWHLFHSYLAMEFASDHCV